VVIENPVINSPWVEAVINHGGFGRREFIEISDPWDAANTVRAMFGSGTI